MDAGGSPQLSLPPADSPAFAGLLALALIAPYVTPSVAHPSVAHPPGRLPVAHSPVAHPPGPPGLHLGKKEEEGRGGRGAGVESGSHGTEQ